jgi:uncharacterized protein (TIGR00255 family)
MTGFGRATLEVAGQSFLVELRALNHRHLDVQLRLPRTFSFVEPEIRSLLRDRFGRGKLDLVVSQPAGEHAPSRVRVDTESALSYLAAARELEANHGVKGHLDVAALLSLPGVTSFADPELPEDAMREALLGAAKRATDAVEQMRSAEGSALERDLHERLEKIESLGRALGARAKDVQKTVRERLLDRMEQLGRETGLTDEARLYHELSLAADRLDVSEELVRLESHVEQFRSLLCGSGEPVGRRCDFLIQEMGREANTVGSKGSDAGIAHLVVELKSELERLREQVQNVE